MLTTKKRFARQHAACFLYAISGQKDGATMMHRGARLSGSGNMSKELREAIVGLLDEFGNLVSNISEDRRFRVGVVRSRLQCALMAILGGDALFVIAQRLLGMPPSIFLDASNEKWALSAQNVLDFAVWDVGFEDPFVISFPRELLEQNEEQRQPALRAIAQIHIDSEYQRYLKMTSLIQINPLFGPASYSLDQRLAFVLMPFAEDLTKIYNDIIKPTVEEKDLVCRRADDLKTNRAIIQDIWKSICEARIVIADLTDLNPNVMYELGIAHTVGKETILIYQLRNEEELKFPFDLAHIRRIQYENIALGGTKLKSELSQTLDSVLERAKLPS